MTFKVTTLTSEERLILEICSCCIGCIYFFSLSKSNKIWSFPICIQLYNEAPNKALVLLPQNTQCMHIYTLCQEDKHID